MKFLLIAVAVFTFASCRTSQLTETNLYFGQTKPNGGVVSEKEWADFRQQYISRVFKEGSSVMSLSGNWYDTAAQKLITEPTYMVSYYYKYSPELSAQVDSLRYWYKNIFQQQSVLRVDRTVKASF